MPKPKLNYTNMLINGLHVGERVMVGKHARFKFTCTTCKMQGERDARYLAKGCTRCNSKAVVEGIGERFIVVTPLEALRITQLQLLMAMRKYPDTPNMPEAMKTRYYLDGRRVRVAEGEEDIFVTQPAKDGKPVVTQLSKLDQQLDDGYDWMLPVHQAPQPAFIDPLETLSDVPLYAPPPPVFTREPVEDTGPDADYVPPEGALALLREKDKNYLDENYEGRELPPQYILDWTEDHPSDATYRIMKANGQWYGLLNPGRDKSNDIDFDDIDMGPPTDMSKYNSKEASSPSHAIMTQRRIAQEEQDALAEAARLADAARSETKPTGTILSFTREADTE